MVWPRQEVSMRSGDSHKLFIKNTTYGRTQAELLFLRLESLIEDISEAIHDEDWGAFTSETYEKWLEGAEGMKAILAMQHLLEEGE